MMMLPFIMCGSFSIRLIIHGLRISCRACTQSSQDFANVFFLFPSPPQKRGKERVAGWARERPTGNTLFNNLGWGACCQSERLLRSPVVIQAGKQEKFRAYCLHLF